MVVQNKPNYRDVSQGDSGPTERKQRLRERFEVVKKLGQGTYGKVQLAVNKETKQEVAIKTIKKAKIENEQDLIRIRREIQIMSSIHHPHIIHIYEVFENPEKIVLIMQYANGGELYDYLGCHKKLDENEARRVFRQVASAIFYCHKNHICHRDLKLENILLDDRGNAKIADFGLSNVFDDRYKLKTFCGSPLYASPEIVRGTPYCGPEVDCWSLGVLLYTLVYGAMPFDGTNFKKLVKQISEGEYFEPREKSGASGLIRRLLTVDINQRATIRDICTDYWVNEGYDHSLLKIAGDLANLTPVRLDLLLALSSESPQTVDQPFKKRTTATEHTKRKNEVCNVYYSTSHPLHIPESSECRGSKKRTVTATDGSSVTKDVEKQQTRNVVDSTKEYNIYSVADGAKECKANLINHERQGNLPLINSKTRSTKNERNTSEIVQDLINCLISKVEQHINISKTVLPERIARKHTRDRRLPDNTSKERGTEGNVLRCEDPKDEFKKGTNSELLQISLEVEGRKSLHQQNGETNTVETFQNSKSCTSPIEIASAIKMSKPPHTPSADKQLDTAAFHEKTAELNDPIFEKRKSFSSKGYNLQNRKEKIKMMEPDVVIPIFNVCCNIPKRSVDALPLDSSKLQNTSRVTTRSSDGTASKAIDERENYKDEASLKNKSKDNSSSLRENTYMGSNRHCRDFTSPEIYSQELNSVKEMQENVQVRVITSKPTKSTDGANSRESLSQTEVPKIPPRKKVLTKNLKPEKSNEKCIISAQHESDDSNNKQISNQHKNKFLQEESRMPQQNEKPEMQMVIKDVNVVSFRDHNDQRPLVYSEDDSALSVNKRAPDIEPNPKLCQRRSRRDFCKFYPSTNEESGYVIKEKQDYRESKIEDSNIKVIASFQEQNIADKTSNEHDKTEVLEESTQLVQIQQNSNSFLENENFFTHDNGKEHLNLEECTEKTTPANILEKVTNEDIYIESWDGHETMTDAESKYQAQGQNVGVSNLCDIKNTSDVTYQWITEHTESRPSEKPKRRSLSRTRAMSMEFESLAQMPPRTVGPPKKPPGKVEIPKTFDPSQPVTSPKAEVKEIIFIPTACVSENKAKIQQKIEKVTKSTITISARRKSDAGVTTRKKKYTRSNTDFIIRSDDLDTSPACKNLVFDEMSRQEAILQHEVTPSPENIDRETMTNEMWYPTVSPDMEPEECEQRCKVDTFDGGFYNENNATASQNYEQHRHSVDTESGYWTPPETGERSTSAYSTIRMKDDKTAKRYDNSEKVMRKKAAFKNSKLLMKLSDEGLDMCSLSSSLESGIYSWKQEDSNGKRISPENETTLKIWAPLKLTEMTSDGSCPPITRSFKKMTFLPEHSSTSELYESCSVEGGADKNSVTDATSIKCVQSYQKPKGADSKPIKPSDSQSSYDSNDTSDDVFENWIEKGDVVPTSKEICLSEDEIISDNLNKNKSNNKNKKARKWQRAEIWNRYSTDKESSDNDDDLDVMFDEFHPAVYGTEGLWQFLKCVNQHLGDQLNTASRKTPHRLECHRSKSQESKHPDEVTIQKRPVTRSLSREEKKRKGDTQLRHFVSEGKLSDADSMDYFQDPYKRFDDTRFSSGYFASGSSLEDSGTLQKDFTCSLDSFHSHADDVSLYGTLRRDKLMHSSLTLSSPHTTKKKSLQTSQYSGEILKTCDNLEMITNDELSQHSSVTEQNRKLLLYGTLRPRHLSQQGKTQSQILLTTDDGYQLLYNERTKKDSPLAVHCSSVGTLRSLTDKASSELNLSVRENRLKDYEKLLCAHDEDTLKSPLVSSATHKNTSCADSRDKKIGSDKRIRRVSFSTDVKTSKSDYHFSLRQNSLNKVREANEELHSSSCYKNNAYNDESDSGSLLEALKTYGYRGIMTQKLQSNPDRYEPRLSYRLPTECLLSSEVNKADWDNFESIPFENMLSYQQPMYTGVDPMEYYQFKTLTTCPQRRGIGEYTDLSCDDESFKDNFRSNRLCEDDVITDRLYKSQDLNDSRSSGRNSMRKRIPDTSFVALNKDQKGSYPDKIFQRENESKEFMPCDLLESHALKQTEKPIEILSEKIQALKSRCQRKSFDEKRLKKEFDDSGIFSRESHNCDNASTVNSDQGRLKCSADPADIPSTQESESSESVSDRIWRKSFYSRFNDISTVRRKNPFCLDSEYLRRNSFLRNTGKFSRDEEGGTEEPWLSTSLKRRNSHQSSSFPRQIMVRSPSLDTDVKGHNSRCTSSCYKQDTKPSDKECKNSATQNRCTDKSVSKKQTAGDENPRSSAKNEVENMSINGISVSNISTNTNSSDFTGLLQENSAKETSAIEIQSNSADTRKISLIDIDPARHPDERTENFPNKSGDVDLLSTVENVSEIKSDFIDGCSTIKNDETDIFTTEQQNSTTSVENLTSALNFTSSETFSNRREENLAESVSVEVDRTQKHRRVALETDRK